MTTSSSPDLLSKTTAAPPLDLSPMEKALTRRLSTIAPKLETGMTKPTTGVALLTRAQLKPIVYISSPYTRGDQALNVRFQMETWHYLMDGGEVLPVAPLWSHFQHLAFPRSYDDWIEYDLAMLLRYDACLRLNAEVEVPGGEDYEQAESIGADREVAEFKRLGRPVYYSVHDMYTGLDRGEF